MNKVNNLEIIIDKFFVVPVILAWYEVKVNITDLQLVLFGLL